MAKGGRTIARAASVIARRDHERRADRLSFVVRCVSGAASGVDNSRSISRGARALSTGVSSRVAERGRPGPDRICRTAAGNAPPRGSLVQPPQLRRLGAAGVDRDSRSPLGIHFTGGGVGAVVGAASATPAESTFYVTSYVASSIERAGRGKPQHAQRGGHHVRGATGRDA